MVAMEPPAAPEVRVRHRHLTTVILLLGGTLALIGCWHFRPAVSAVQSVADGRGRAAGSRRLGQGFELTAYKPKPRPVFFMHGLAATSGAMAAIAYWVGKELPGTETHNIMMYEGDDSWTSLLTQVPKVEQYIRDTIKQYPDSFKNGYDLVCHSQGAVICRTLVEDMDDHEVHTLISLAGPQMGAWGDEMKLQSGVNKMLLEADLGDLMYFPVLQRTNSLSNMWHDPVRHEEYVKGNEFLPVYNGLTDDKEGNARRKANFIRLRKAVFLVGDWSPKEFDGNMEPWQSAIWGYYKIGSTTEFLEMRQTEEYIKDTFGLKTLDQQGRLFTQAPPRVPHGAWVSDYNTVKKYVLPHLGGQ